MASVDERLLNEAESAQFLGLSPNTLNRWRCLRKGPEFVKLGGRSVRYRLSDLTAWVESQRKMTSGAKGGAAC